MVDLLRELLSKQQAARTAMELILGSTAVIDQLRGIMRDFSTPGPVRVGSGNRLTSKRPEVDAWLFLGLGAAVLSLEQRRQHGARRLAGHNHR